MSFHFSLCLFSQVNKANGPFDAVFCVGQVFPDKLTPEVEEQLNSFFSGKTSFPVPLYFIGDYGEGTEKFLESFLERKLEEDPSFKIDEEKELQLCHNLFWLRKSGVFDLKGRFC